MALLKEMTDHMEKETQVGVKLKLAVTLRVCFTMVISCARCLCFFFFKQFTRNKQFYLIDRSRTLLELVISSVTRQIRSCTFEDLMRMFENAAPMWMAAVNVKKKMT